MNSIEIYLNFMQGEERRKTPGREQINVSVLLSLSHLLEEEHSIFAISERFEETK